MCFLNIPPRSIIVTGTRESPEFRMRVVAARR